MPTESGQGAESRFFDISPELMCIANFEGYFVKLNPIWQETLGFSLEELYGNSFMEFIHPEDRPSTEEAMAVLSKGETVRNFINRYRLKSGGYIWLCWQASYDRQSKLIYAIARDVTEQERMRASIAVIERVTGVGVWEINQETKELYWSDKIHEIHETDPQNYYPVLEEGINFYAPEAIPPLKEALKHLALTGEPYSLDLPFITAKNNHIWVNARGFTEQKNGNIVRQYGTFENITNKREQRLEKQKLRERIDLSLKTSNIGIWELEIADNRLYWDDQMHKLYGVSQEQFSGQVSDWSDRLHPQDKDKTEKCFADAMSGIGEFNTQFRIITPQGDTRHIATMATFSSNEQGEPVRATGVNWDVTEQALARKALEEEKKRAEENEQLAQKATLAKSAFLANMSHEIRTPMNGILGALQLLQSELSEDSKAGQLLDQALLSTKGLIKIINDILDFSKIDANQLSFEQAEVDLFELIDRVCTEQKLANQSDQLQLNFNFDKSMPSHWLCDPVRVKQIISNIVSNALKFTKHGQVYLSVKHNVQYMDKSNLAIEIKDTGIGIKSEALAQLFDSFTQEDNTTTRKFGGTGLGLTISRMLARLMDGDVVVQSEVGVGSTFTIYLPLTAVDQTHAKPKDNPVEVPQFSNLAGYRVLLAEDNEINLQVLKAMLIPTNAEIETTKDGQALLEAYRQNKPDLILTDIQMPVMDGMEACKIIRQTDNETPIIAVTANVMTQDRQKYNDCGFDSCVAKPILVADLFKVINAVINKN